MPESGRRLPGEITTESAAIRKFCGDYRAPTVEAAVNHHPRAALAFLLRREEPDFRALPNWQQCYQAACATIEEYLPFDYDLAVMQIPFLRDRLPPEAVGRWSETARETRGIFLHLAELAESDPAAVAALAGRVNRAARILLRNLDRIVFTGPEGKKWETQAIALAKDLVPN
ncbi:MAG: hypothetical protein HYV42_03050 [Candidatus Magasanikbacteria bacterium]|nr:hypothetical protein [Candidatus Magasanikbacteria bacterium]